MSEEAVREIAKAVGGEIKEMGALPDGSGFAVMSMPLPKDHWIYGDAAREDEHGYECPPMPLRLGGNDVASMGFGPRGAHANHRFLALDRNGFADRIRAAGKYAVRAATMKGKEMDFDPDALLQNLIVGLIGYWTPDGLSHDEWANPKEGPGLTGQP